MQFKTRDGVSIYYEQNGDALAKNKVLFVMGFRANCKGWEFQVKYFSSLPDYQTVIFDNRGAGLSDVGNLVPYTMDLMSNDAIDLVNFLNWDNFHLVGISMGGMISQHVALKIPEKIATLTLISTRLLGGFWDQLPAFRGVIQVIKLMTSSTSEAQREAAVDMMYPLPYLSEISPNGITYRNEIYKLMEKHQEGIPEITKRGEDAQKNAIMKHGLSVDQLTALKNAKFPKIAIAGDLDILITADHSEKMKDLINATVFIIKGGGHVINVQCSDVVNNHIKTLIEESHSSQTNVEVSSSSSSSTTTVTL